MERPILQNITHALNLEPEQVDFLEQFPDEILKTAYLRLQNKPEIEHKLGYLINCCKGILHDKVSGKQTLRGQEQQRLKDLSASFKGSAKKTNPNHPPKPKWQYNRQENMDYFNIWYQKHGQQYSEDMGINLNRISARFMDELEKQLNDPRRSEITQNSQSSADDLKKISSRILTAHDFNPINELPTAIELATEMYKNQKVNPKKMSFLGMDQTVYQQRILYSLSHMVYRKTNEAGEDVAISYINKIKNQFDNQSKFVSTTSKETVKDSGPQHISYFLKKIISGDNSIPATIENEAQSKQDQTKTNENDSDIDSHHEENKDLPQGEFGITQFNYIKDNNE
jgi:hypothetical protein